VSRPEVVAVRSAKPNDLVHLAKLEEAADTEYWKVGYPMMPAAATVSEYASALALLVVGDPPVGFARLEELEGAVHLEQISVHPAHMRRGIGKALLEATCEWARNRGYHAVTLMTFRDVPWNEPFYARHGFVEIRVPRGQLARLVVHDQDLGMEAIGRRVVMQLELKKETSGSA
jgi:GNAT superfamily N-acetyltransferase